jgi:hypothetical protein
MAATSTLPTQEETFARLAKDYPASDLSWPKLRPPEDPLQSYWDRFLKWLGQQFPKPETTTPLDGEKIWQVATVALKYAMIVLGCFLLFLVIRGLLRRTKLIAPTGKEPFELPEVNGDHRTLTDEIRDALAAGHYALAGRLRWKLFLRRAAQPPTRTLQEFLHSRASFPSETAREYEALMFRMASATDERYRQFDHALVSLEENSNA